MISFSERTPSTAEIPIFSPTFSNSSSILASTFSVSSSTYFFVTASSSTTGSAVLIFPLEFLWTIVFSVGSSDSYSIFVCLPSESVP